MKKYLIYLTLPLTVFLLTFLLYNPQTNNQPATVVINLPNKPRPHSEQSSIATSTFSSQVLSLSFDFPTQWGRLIEGIDPPNEGRPYENWVLSGYTDPQEHTFFSFQTITPSTTPLRYEGAEIFSYSNNSLAELCRNGEFINKKYLVDPKVNCAIKKNKNKVSYLNFTVSFYSDYVDRTYWIVDGILVKTKSEKFPLLVVYTQKSPGYTNKDDYTKALNNLELIGSSFSSITKTAVITNTYVDPGGIFYLQYTHPIELSSKNYDLINFNSHLGFGYYITGTVKTINKSEFKPISFTGKTTLYTTHKNIPITKENYADAGGLMVIYTICPDAKNYCLQIQAGADEGMSIEPETPEEIATRSSKRQAVFKAVEDIALSVTIN